MDSLFKPYQLGRVRLRNRIIRSGVYEGRADRDGYPGRSYVAFYEALARGGAGGIVTGFAYISKDGRAMHPFQAGIDHPDKIPHFKKATLAVHKHGCPIFLQIAHTGRQTRRSATGEPVRGCSSGRSAYFREKPRPFTAGEVKEKVNQFARAASMAREAGFDGVQLHGAHGYLIHQFLRNSVNKRKDAYGTDGQGLGLEFFRQVILAVKHKCGDDFPVLVKISGRDDLSPPFTEDQFNNLVRFLDTMGLAAVEISYGTMDHPLNIFRGEMPVGTIMKKNPILHSENLVTSGLNRLVLQTYYRRRQIPFTPAYNLSYAVAAKRAIRTPVISVGGFRNMQDLLLALESCNIDLVGMARPFICEPDIVEKLMKDRSYESRCRNCNLCAVMCDTETATRCFNHQNN